MKSAEGGTRQRERKARRGWYAVSVLAVILAALLIVGADLRRFRRKTISSTRIRIPTDTTLTRWRGNMYRRVRHLEAKYLGYRVRDREYTEGQSTFARDADSAFEAVFDELLAFDAIGSFRLRIRKARQIKRMFADLKKPVYKFARSIFIADSLRDVRRESLATPPP